MYCYLLTSFLYIFFPLTVKHVTKLLITTDFSYFSKVCQLFCKKKLRYINKFQPTQTLIYLRSLFNQFPQEDFCTLSAQLRIQKSIVLRQGSANCGPQAKCSPQSQSLRPESSFSAKYVLKSIKIKDFVIKTYS